VGGRVAGDTPGTLDRASHVLDERIADHAQIKKKNKELP
jgi:hypothetical protein